MNVNKIVALPIADAASRRLATAWLLLGLGALTLSSLFALMLVLLRIPYLHSLMPFRDMFPAALVVHVDLAVLVWFLSLAGVFWSLLGTKRAPTPGLVAVAVATVGTLLMVSALPEGSGLAIMSNYVPVLDNTVFLFGLGLFAVGIVIMAIRGLAIGNVIFKCPTMTDVLRIGAGCAAVATLVAMLTVLITYRHLPLAASGRVLYEQLFWGGGHVLQFTHTSLMMVAWLVLAAEVGASAIPRRKLIYGFILMLLPVLFILFLEILNPAALHDRALFTQLMRWGGWPVPVILGLAILNHCRGTGCDSGVSVTPLRFSVLLFGTGLLVGALIHDDTLLVTAHYHGTVGAVTLAYMGLTYQLLPRLGFSAVSARAIRVQARLYACGLLMLISGLAWSGLQGILRKAAGAAQHMHGLQEIIGMVLMAIGGVVGLSAIWLFLILVARSLLKTGGYRARIRSTTNTTVMLAKQ